MDKSDKLLSSGAVLITISLIMWETFGMMVAPTVLTVAAAGCFVVAGLCATDEERSRERECKRKWN